MAAQCYLYLVVPFEPLPPYTDADRERVLTEFDEDVARAKASRSKGSKKGPVKVVTARKKKETTKAKTPSGKSAGKSKEEGMSDEVMMMGW